MKLLFKKIHIFTIILLFALFLANITIQAKTPVTTKFMDIPMSEYQLVYTIASGSLLYDFKAEIDEFRNDVQQYSINPLKIVIIFLDNDSTAQNIDIKTAKQELNEFNDGKLSTSLDINLEFLNSVYPYAYLNTKRKVIIGALLLPTIVFTDTKTIKSVNFPINKIKGFQVIFDIDNTSEEDKNAFIAYSRSSIIRYINKISNMNDVTLLELNTQDTPAYIFGVIDMPKSQLLNLYNDVAYFKELR